MSFSLATAWQRLVLRRKFSAPLLVPGQGNINATRRPTERGGLFRGNNARVFPRYRDNSLLANFPTLRHVRCYTEHPLPR